MKRWTKGRALLAATALGMLCLGYSAPAWARTNHALLMAVTAYPNLPPKNALIGPNHDASLVREFLTSRAPVAFEADNVTVLADDLDGAHRSPTRANILEALQNLTDKAEKGDFVYIHYSGHGSQQPTRTPETETDGLDEILLPSDSMPWDKAEKRIPNALVDDEIGTALDAIRDKGAFVWIVVDACNSGDVTRAASVNVGDDEVTRKLDPTDPEGLGIPGDAIAEAIGGAAAGRTQDKTALRFADGASESDRSFQDGSADSAEAVAKGGMVAFFAAQTIETTPEMPLPRGAEDAQRLGLFTFTLFSKLAENPNLTYRQLGHSILQQYGADARQAPTPIFEGALDARVFGSEADEVVMQWPLAAGDNGFTLPAGRLHRLAPGTRLAIVPTPGADLSEARGYLEVVKADNLSSRVVPVAHDGKPALKLSDVPDNAYARLAEIAIDYKLTIARPAAADGLEEDAVLANAVLGELAGAADGRFNIELVEPGAPADIRLGVFRESDVDGAPETASDEAALWFLPASGEMSLEAGRRPPSIIIDRSDRDRLAALAGESLQKIFRATALSRLSVASGEQPSDVMVRFDIRRTAGGDVEAMAAAAVPTVTPGDQVHIVAENNSNDIVDINILYVGSDYSIVHIDSRRLVSGAKLATPLLAFTEDSFGTERMVAVVTEAPPLSAVEDLSFLEQGKVPTTTRSSGAFSDFAAALSDIGLASATRSVVRLGEQSAPKNAVMIYPVETRPAN